jgi:inosine-uridine nucleoside N-ribohydrolase
LHGVLKFACIEVSLKVSSLQPECPDLAINQRTIAMTDKPIPVILDTDIGTDIDDTWALAMLLKCPELDLKLVVSTAGDTPHRARILCRLLEIAGRTDIPVGIGVRDHTREYPYPQAPWVRDYPLADYPGTVHEDGVGATIDMLMAAPEPVTLVTIGPLGNIGAALRRAPGIAPRTRYVGMQGSIHRNVENAEGAIAEWNVVCDIPAAQAVFAAPWLSAAITPLDTCGRVRLREENYRAVTACADPLTRAVIDNYRIWLGGQPDEASSILFDTVAVHLAYSTRYLKMETMGLRVDGEGYMRPDPAAPPVNVALDWLDLVGFENELSRIMTVRA